MSAKPPGAGRPPGNSADGKKRLLDACWELLVETPQGERLTIAAVCERARCTPPTLYHHFGDLASLERAASRRAYFEWNDYMDSRCAVSDDPKERILERQRAYVAWAMQHPDAYHVLFSQPRKTLDPNGEEVKGPGTRAMLQDLAQIHGTDADDDALLPLLYANWSGVHGLASLSIAVSYFPEEVRETTLRILADSLMTHGPGQLVNVATPVEAFAEAS